MQEENLYTRTASLLGEAATKRLQNARVAVFGVGGVGSYAAEALARAGVGHFLLVDGDTVAPSNLNRQLVALNSTLGKPKADVMCARILDINPQAEVDARFVFFDETTLPQFDFSKYDYVADAIDSVSAKVTLIAACHASGTPIISALGAGNKLFPNFAVADIYETSVCPLARVLRPLLKKRGILRSKVIYSKEPPRVQPEAGGNRRIPASVSYVPAAMGLTLAGEIIRHIAEVEA